MLLLCCIGVQSIYSCKESVAVFKSHRHLIINKKSRDLQHSKYCRSHWLKRLTTLDCSKQIYFSCCLVTHPITSISRLRKVEPETGGWRIRVWAEAVTGNDIDVDEACALESLIIFYCGKIHQEINYLSEYCWYASWY